MPVNVDLVPALRAPMEAVAAYLQTYGDALRAPWGRRRQANALKATTSLAVRFSTWQALDAAGLDDEGMAALTWQWMRAAAEPVGAPARSAAPG